MLKTETSGYLPGLISFLKSSPTAFHATASICRLLKEAGFSRLSETERWQLEKGGSYYTVRNDSSVIAFKIGRKDPGRGFLMAASHSDSPSFKIKEKEEIRVRGHYLQLNTEGYGGMICSSWMDRPLSVAGRVLVRKKNPDGSISFETRLIDFGRDLVLIPNLAIHMNRAVNEGLTLNKQVDMVPLFAGGEAAPGLFREMTAAEAGASPEDILGTDLFLYNRMEPSVWGARGEYISAPRLDDLECAYGTLLGFIDGGNDRGIQVYGCFDNEEVGSRTRQGAASTFLRDVLRRVTDALGMDDEDFRCMCARSMMICCDNAHAVHPNHPEKSDPENCTYMNGGIVIKSHAGQKYTSDGISIALFRGICEKAGVTCQSFANRSDMTGGSTLGNIAMSQVSMHCVDLGLPQLAMHSAYETAGTKDLDDLVLASRVFFSSALTLRGDGSALWSD